MTKIRLYILTFVLLLSVLSSVAQYRPVYSMYSIAVGRSSVLDTYLSQQRYSGLAVRFDYERLQAMRFNPERWTMQMQFGIDYSYPKNMVKNHVMHALMANFSWGMMHRWRDVGLKNLTFTLGGETAFNGGVIYSQINSNNPVSAKIRWHIGLSGSAIYNFKLKNLPITLRYEATLPLLGVFFSPEYDESFYEIYLGNTKNLAHFGSWGNRFDMVNKLYADFHFGSTSLRIGYRGTVERSWVCNLNTQIYTNTFILGVGGEWININPRHPQLDGKAKVISAIY